LDSVEQKLVRCQGCASSPVGGEQSPLFEGLEVPRSLSLVDEAVRLDAVAGQVDSCLYLSIGVKNGEFLKHRVGRFKVRAFRGVACGLAKGYRFRWFVLTESDEAISARIDFDAEFHRFIRWLRYWCPDFQYIVVEHRQGDKQRRNWHVLSYGSDRLPVLAMRAYWLEHFKSTVTGMAEVRDVGRGIGYLCRYVGDSEKFVRSWQSHGWVYSGWVRDSVLHRRMWGEYPPERVVTALSLMSPDERGCEFASWVYRGHGVGVRYRVPDGEWSKRKRV
jgi:hypothetical protein